MADHPHTPVVGKRLLLEALHACDSDADARAVAEAHLGSATPISPRPAPAPGVVASPSRVSPVVVSMRPGSARAGSGYLPTTEPIAGDLHLPTTRSKSASNASAFAVDNAPDDAVPDRADLDDDGHGSGSGSGGDKEATPPLASSGGVTHTSPITGGSSGAGAGSGGGAETASAPAASAAATDGEGKAEREDKEAAEAKGGEAAKAEAASEVPPNSALAQDEPAPPSVGVWSVECRRGHENEDRARCVLDMPSPAGPVTFVSVIDGHGGGECADFLQETLHVRVSESEEWGKGDFAGALRHGIAACEREFLATGKDSGACLVVGLLVGGGISGAEREGVAATRPRRLVVANVGDCRAVLASLDGRTVRQITKDHKPGDPEEHKRVEDAGGRIFVGRLFGIIAVARSVGDAQLKGDGPGGTALSPIPDIFEITLSDDGCGVAEGGDGKKGEPESGDGVLVLACDGVWDELTNEQVAQKAAEGLAKGAKRAARKLASIKAAGDATAARVRDPGAHLAARQIVSSAAETGYDDCTAVVVPLCRRPRTSET